MSPIVIHQWAHALAERVARETGWRASEIYSFAVERFIYQRDTEATERLIARIVDLRASGESFRDVVARLTHVVDSLEG